MTLWDLPAGSDAIVATLDAGLDARIVQRLQELGFGAGSRVTCTSAPRLGAPRAYLVGNAVYALEHAVASRVQLEGDVR